MVATTNYEEKHREDIESAGTLIEKIATAVIGRPLGHANTSTIFGQETTQGERTIIPVGRISSRYGFGGGSGHGVGEDSESGGSGGGGGGGGMIEVKPIGYIEVTPESSRFVQINDSSAIAIRAITIWGIVGLVFVVSLFRTIRARNNNFD